MGNFCYRSYRPKRLKEDGANEIRTRLQPEELLGLSSLESRCRLPIKVIGSRQGPFKEVDNEHGSGAPAGTTSLVSHQPLRVLLKVSKWYSSLPYSAVLHSSKPCDSAQF